MIALGLSSCSSSEIIISDTISEHSANAILEIKKVKERNPNPELADLLGTSIAIFSVFSDQNTPVDSAELLHDSLFSQVNEMGLFSTVLDEQQLNELLNKNRQLAQKKELYIDSLMTVSVSNKDISNPLGKYLTTENFLVFQLDRWPCSECSTPLGMRMKLRIVDAESGYIVWTAIAESRNLSLEELNDLMPVAIKLKELLSNTFYASFKKKWHRKRFAGLTNS